MAIAINPTTLDIPITLADMHVSVVTGRTTGPRAAFSPGGVRAWLERRTVSVPFVGDENDATGSATAGAFLQDYEVISVRADYDAAVPSATVLTVSSPDASANGGVVLAVASATDTRYHPRDVASKAADGTAVTDGHNPIVIPKGSVVTCDLTMTGGVVGSPAAINLGTGVFLTMILKSVR